MWDDWGDYDGGWDYSVDGSVNGSGEGGGVAVDPGDTGVTDSDVDGGNGDPIVYDDGSVYYPDTGEIFDGTTGELLGNDSGYGDGSWFNTDGQLFNSNNEWVPDVFFVQDSTTGQWYDSLTGTWYDDDGQVSELQPRDPPNSPIDIDGNPVTDLPTDVPGPNSNTPGFLDKLGNALKNLFSGGGSGNSGGGSQNSASGAAQQRQQQAQNALQKAQQSGNASPALIATLQKQLAAAQAVAAATSGGMTQTILIAGIVGLGVYALTSRRN